MIDFSFFLLYFSQLALEFSILSEEATGYNLILACAFFLLIQKDLLQVLQLILNDIIGLHHLLVVLLRLVLLLPHRLVLLLNLLELQLVLRNDVISRRRALTQVTTHLTHCVFSFCRVKVLVEGRKLRAMAYLQFGRFHHVLLR